MNHGFKISVLIMTLGLVLVTSCTKNQIQVPIENEPVFTIDGTLGGEAFSLTAGDNNAYMQTSTELCNGVRVFSGNLTDGETSIELGIFDGNIDNPNHVAESDLINVPMKFARQPSDPLLVLSKDVLNQYQNIESIKWYINGSNAGADYAYIMEPGKYDVCAIISFIGTSGATAELCDEIIVGYERSANCSIEYYIAQNQIEASINSIGANVTSVEWFLDNVSIGNNLTLFDSLDQDFHVLTARVTFDNEVVREKSCLINGSNPLYCIQDFSIFELTSASNFANQDYKLRLNITRNGLNYRSIHANNENSSVTLLSLEYYDENANGNKVYNATIQVEAIVMEMVTEKLIPINFIAILGVEVP